MFHLNVILRQNKLAKIKWKVKKKLNKVRNNKKKKEKTTKLIFMFLYWIDVAVGRKLSPFLPYPEFVCLCLRIKIFKLLFFCSFFIQQFTKQFES